MRLIAIDPGTHQGWAVFENGHLVASGLGNEPDMRADEVVIEVPEYRRASRVSPNDLIALAVKVGRVAAFYSSSGATVTLIKPSKWKGSVPKDVHHSRALEKLKAHEIARVHANHNTLDAIALGLTHLKRMGRGGV